MAFERPRARSQTTALCTAYLKKVASKWILINLREFANWFYRKDLIKVKKVKKDSLDEEDAGYEEQDYGSLDHNVRGSFMPRSSHRKGSASMLPLTDGSNPQRQLIELNSRFDSIFSAAEDLKKQADLQAEQLKQIRSEIQSTKELNDVRHEMLQQALMKGLMSKKFFV